MRLNGSTRNSLIRVLKGKRYGLEMLFDVSFSVAWIRSLQRIRRICLFANDASGCGFTVENTSESGTHVGEVS